MVGVRSVFSFSVGHLILVLILATLAAACGPAEPAEPESGNRPALPVSRQVHLMGTVATLTVHAKDRPRGLDRIEQFVRTLELAEAQLSSWRADSLISRLNRHPIGLDFPLPPRICRLFAEIFRWNRKTEGAFDPAVASLISAWGIRQEGRLPSPAELAAALGRSGMRRFRFDDGTCRLARLSEAGLDSGAFGKGAALDWLRETPPALEGPWLVDLGGQIAVGEEAPRPDGWAVALADPRSRDSAALELTLETGSLATSGGSERDLEAEGERVGHILDPRDGRPAAYRGSVTVWHESALTADILSTALYVMGPEKGLPWAERQGVVAVFLPDSGEPQATPQFEKRFFHSPGR